MEKEKNIVNNDILRSNYTNHIFYSFLNQGNIYIQ